MIFLKSEPTGESYFALLRFLEQRSHFFSLVLKRSKHGRHKTAQEYERRLEPFLLREDEVREWPGTLLGSSAGVARLGVYRIERSSMDILGTLEGLYQWCLPEHPEDLAFYSRNMKCIFSSTAHETTAMLRSGDITEEEFRSKVPGVDIKWYHGSRD